MEVVQLLLERGADVNAQGGKHYENALQAASYRGHFDIVQLLLQSGAKVTHTIPSTKPWFSHKLKNALEAAAVNGHKDVVKLLLDHGVEQEHLDTALRSARKKDIVNLLLEHGAR